MPLALPLVLTRRRFVRLGAAAAGATACGLPLETLARESRAQRRERTRVHNEAVIRSVFDVDVPLYDWKRLVVHHTATKAGWLKGIDAYHRNHFGDPLGAEYHFVINNGRKLPAGWLEVGRWRYQEPAWHLFHPERAPDAIAICLVGNFEEQKVGEHQLAALVDLSAALMRGLGIGTDAITTHRGVDGILTQCPGKNFPLEQYLAALRKRESGWKAAMDPPAPTQALLTARPSLRCLP